jgi:predicted RNA-binding Zn ribbon-like protein
MVSQVTSGDGPPAPIVVAGHPALDLLNTVASPAGEPVEFLADGAALVRWLVASGLLDAAGGSRVARRFARSELDAAARRVVGLREWLRPLVRRAAETGAARLSPSELHRLNAALAGAARVASLVPSGRGYAVGRALRWESPDALLVLVAEAIADLVATARFALVRECAGPGCTLWFLDRTKAHRRQWCSMAVCGNRAKVAAHRRRARRAVRRRRAGAP